MAKMAMRGLDPAAGTDGAAAVRRCSKRFTGGWGLRVESPLGSVQNLSQCAGRPATSSRCKSDTMKGSDERAKPCLRAQKRGTPRDRLAAGRPAIDHTGRAQQGTLYEKSAVTITSDIVRIRYLFMRLCRSTF